MESAWDQMDHGKRSINSIIGRWCIDDCFAHRLVSSNDERDAPEGSLKSTFYYEGGCVTDYISWQNIRGIIAEVTIAPPQKKTS